MRFQSLLLPILAAALCGHSQSADPYTLAGGSRLLLALATPVNTAYAKPGDVVYLTTDFPVFQRGRAVVPVGSTVAARLTAVTPSKVHGRASLQLTFDSLSLSNGVSKPMHATLLAVSIEGAAVDPAEGALHATSGKALPHCLNGTIIALTTAKYPNLVLPKQTALEVSLDKPIVFYEDELMPMPGTAR